MQAARRRSCCNCRPNRILPSNYFSGRFPMNRCCYSLKYTAIRVSGGKLSNCFRWLKIALIERLCGVSIRTSKYLNCKIITRRYTWTRFKTWTFTVEMRRSFYSRMFSHHIFTRLSKKWYFSSRKCYKLLFVKTNNEIFFYYFIIQILLKYFFSLLKLKWIWRLKPFFCNDSETWPLNFEY